MADMVTSALAQEGVSRASSYISTKLEEQASTAHNMARLEMALSQLEYALERAGNIPITSIALLRRMKMMKSAYAEGMALLNKHKMRVLQDKAQAMEGSHDAVGRAVTMRYPLLAWIGRAKSLPISSLLGLNEDHYLSSDAVHLFERYADFADKFVADVESGNPLVRGTFRYPFVRQLLEGKALWYDSIRGCQRMHFHMLPQRWDDRGVEAHLYYGYKDFRATESDLCVRLTLRLSESTDIVGTAIKCMKLLTSQLKLVIVSAVEELMQLADLQDVSDSYEPPLTCIQDTYWAGTTKYWRPDPICCSGNGPRDLTNNIISPESSNQFLEPVIVIDFSCCISAPEYKLCDTNAPAPRLRLQACFAPHLPCGGQSEIILEYRDREECRSGSMEQMEEIVASNALNYLVLEPQPPTDYAMYWFSAHGSALVSLEKWSNEETLPKPTPAPRRGRSAAKRKR